MKEAFTKIKEAIANIHRVVKTDEDLEWNRAIYKCSTIVSEVEAEFGKDINFLGNPKTNADRIRSMSDEELADFLEEFEACDVCKYHDKDRCTFENICVHEFAGAMIWEWLKSPTTD